MSYTPNEWLNGDVITAAKLNNMENGIANNDAAASKVAVFTLTLSTVDEDPVLTAEVSAADIAEEVSSGKYPLFFVSNDSGMYAGWSSFSCNIDETNDSVRIEIIAGQAAFECETTLSSTEHAVFTAIS